MSAPVDRITAVLRKHYLVDNWGCACSASVRGTTGWAEHVAEQVAALFTEETRTFRKSGGHPIQDRVWRRRWVSGWAEMEEQPAPPGFAPICEGCGGANSRHFYLCSRATAEDRP